MILFFKRNDRWITWQNILWIILDAMVGHQTLAKVCQQLWPINVTTCGSPNNDTYRSLIFTNISTYTSTIISWFILHWSTVSWLVSTISTMIVFFIVFWLICISASLTKFLIILRILFLFHLLVVIK
jgi:hypothetical protein